MMDTDDRETLLTTIAAQWGASFKLYPSASFNSASGIQQMTAALTDGYDIEPAVLQRANVAMCFYGDALVLSDDVLDYTASEPSWVREVPQVGAYFIQACMLWAGLFSIDSEFWPAMQRYHREYLESMRLEADILAGTIPWQDCDEPLCLKLVRGKNGPCRIIAATVAALTDDMSRLQDYEELTLGLFAATQLLDDLQDWREDLRDGTISLLLRRTSAQRPNAADAPILAKRMYLEGHVDYVLGLAQQQCELLIELSQRLDRTKFTTLIASRIQQVEQLRAALQADVASQLARLRRA